VINHILACDFERICIVGKEPLADARSVDTVCRIIELASQSGKTVSLVTNGLNGDMLPDSALKKLAWVDVSVDGGQLTYGTYRRASWEKLRRSVTSMRARGLRELRLLHTLSATTVSSIVDMVEAGDALSASHIVFSPYQPTRAQGVQGAIPISPTEIIEAIEPFAGDRRIHLSFDAGYASRFKDTARAIELATSLLGDRFTYVDTDPVDRGIIRVTYDGLVLTPFEAVNTTDYQALGREVLLQPLDVWFGEMLRSSRWASLH
jgi:MoaA/NifB/PqqE/SkfB family radical SAM enzyme